MKKEAAIVLTVFILLMLMMAALSYFGYDNWTYEP
jgi:hypothetical protein